MLHGLDERIAALPAERRAKGVVVVMHQMGSHGPAYYKRSPQAVKRFLPECTSNAPAKTAAAKACATPTTTPSPTPTTCWPPPSSGCGAAPRSDTALLYVADHGESLGENNLYLHGMPYAIAPDVQKRVPWITWLSPGFEQRRI
jgi:lipid A ethanolaminephosphotransferase